MAAGTDLLWGVGVMISSMTVGEMTNVQVAMLLLLWVAPAWAARAQSAPGDSGYESQVIRCESRDMLRKRCPADTSRGVELVRQLSGQECIRETDWGIDSEGIWVSHGCRAEFRAGRRAASVPMRRVVRCESKGRPVDCPVQLRGAPVRLLRQLSVMPCREGDTWGRRRNEIWVKRGCQGEFEVGAADGSGFLDLPREVVCESRRKLRRTCGTSISREAVLVKQLSGAPCEQDVTWGWNRDGVWVDNGCRAVFSVN